MVELHWEGSASAACAAGLFPNIQCCYLHDSRYCEGHGNILAYITRLLCLMGDLAGGVSVAVAVDVSDEVTGDTQHITHDP